MSYLLFLDDERQPPSSEWVVARTTEQAKNIVQTQGWPSHVSLDGHLGLGEQNGLVFAWWLCERHAEDPAPESFEYSIHTADVFMSAQMENKMHEVFGKASLNHQPDWWLSHY